MKKQKNHSLLNSFFALLSELSPGQQFLTVIFFLILFFLFSWRYFSPYFHTEIRTTSTASYDDLDPTSYGYWRERTERDIASARELAKPSLPQYELLSGNIAATIRATHQIKDPAEKALAISSIIYAQIDQNVNTNIDEALFALGNSTEVRSLRMNLAASLALFYQPTDRSKAASSVQNYLSLLKEILFNPEVPEQKNALVQILDACVLLNLDRELDAILKHLLSSTNLTSNESRKNILLAFAAEQQIRFQKYADALATLTEVTQTDLLVKCYCKLIESRAQVTTAVAGETASQGKIRHPDLVAQTLERVFINIGRIKDQQIQQETLYQLLESDMMAHTNLHDLVRSVLIETHSLQQTVKVQALSLVDNPRSETLRQALGMPPLASTPESDGENLTDEQLFERAQQLTAPPPLSKNRMYQEDIRILTNTATELLNWGKKKEAILLLNRAAERIKGLNLENKQGVSRTTLAAILVSAGEIETAQDLLHEESEILKFSQRTSQTDLDYGRIAEIQLRARLLEETFQTLREMLPGTPKTNLLQSLAAEQIKIGQFNDARRSVAEMPASPAKTAMQYSLRETLRRLQQKMQENVYANPPLTDILKSDWPDKQQRLFDLTATQVQEGLFVDARETARNITDLTLRNRALDLVVQETVAVFRAYFSRLPLHGQVRENMFSFGFQTAKEISSPLDQLLAMERVYSQKIGFPDSTNIIPPEWDEMIKQWDALPDTENLAVKIDCGLRLLQAEMRRHASEVRGRVGGNWFLLPEGTSFPTSEQKQILLKIAKLVPQLKSVDERVVRLAQLAALFHQIRDSENGKSHITAAAGACEAVEQKNIAANVYLSLAQTLHEAGVPEESENMFVKAVEQAEKILSEEAGKKIDRLLEKRMKDRILADICRGQAEIGQISGAMQTATKIGEKFFVDRLCKTIGYLQISLGAYEDAEATFKKIKNPNWKNSCLNDALFRRRWNDLVL